MLFSDLAHAFKVIEGYTSRNSMTKALADLFNEASDVEARIISYLSLGLLRAAYEGTQFNFAEKNMIKVAAEVLGLTQAAVKSKMQSEGDLGSVVASGDWHANDPSLTVVQVYQKLMDFEATVGEGSQEEKVNSLRELLFSVDPLSACFIVRIILQKLRLGFSEMTVIDALSWSVAGDKSLRKELEHAFNIATDIGLIAFTLKKGGIEAIEKISITIGIPIRPAAAERLPSARAIIKKIGPCAAQPKYDGFRLQVHVDKRGEMEKIHFFSRNMLDMSDMFPDLLEAIQDIPVKTLIVEGEALAYDENSDSYLPFQETVKRRRKHDIEAMAQEMPLKLVLFDILYKNEKSLLEEPHFKRQEILVDLFARYKNDRISVTTETSVETAEELENYFLHNISAGLEGVVVKKPDAPYQPGKRNFNWIKLKHQEEGHLDDTIDVVILGYYHGHGRRAPFGIGALLVGVYDEVKDRFETIAKIGTGLSDSGWKELKKKCDDYAIDHRLPNVECAKELVPDVWVAPGLVIVVRADEITRSPVHSAGADGQTSGYALRFPRFMAYREDKSATEATTVHEIKTLFKQQYK